MYAHSVAGRPKEEWERLSEHLDRVARGAGERAEAFGWRAVAEALARLHDIGKASEAFQRYIDGMGDATGPDHSTAGAREAEKLYGSKLGRLLAFAVAGHHAGLADWTDLERRLAPDYRIEPYGGWQAEAGELPAMAELRPTMPWKPGPEAGFSWAFLARMLFSCLVDADFIETERFYEGCESDRGGHCPIKELRDRLSAFMADKARWADPTPVNALRARVLEHAVKKATELPGFFTLTVPTGGGKTLASLSFALEHAAKHKLRRVVYVIPFTSIIEQTAQVFWEALDARDDVLEHHASFDWDAPRGSLADEEGADALKRLRRAAENWDAPVVVTTAVQFFESLFAARTSRCRKLHNLAGSVIVLDEAQTMPVDKLLPCLAALDELQRNYGASVVLCTATQPAVRKIDGALVEKPLPGQREGKNHGLDIPGSRELAPDPKALYEELKRVDVEVRTEPVTDEEIAGHFAEQDRMLVIVNGRAHAKKLFDMIEHLPGRVHLTTLMCPKHRRQVLAGIRGKLAKKEPVRLVATSLIEAGVDVDFPEVWRAAAGLDSIAQAAGRANREGKLPHLGRVVVFVPAEAKPPSELEAFWQAARPVIRNHARDLLGLDAVKGYFSELYFQKDISALDGVAVDGRRGILPALNERADEFTFPFRSLADAFRMIDSPLAPVIVPWDEAAQEVLRAITFADRPRGRDLRKLQQYVVSVPPKARDEWLRRGALQPVHPALGDDLLKFGDLAHYRPDTGLDLDDLGLRSAESNLC